MAARAPDEWITRRTLHEGRLFQLGYVVCRPTPDVRTEVEYPALNALALPISGVFAVHHGTRHHVVATPNHAVFLASGKPCRITFPGNVGDECLVMRLTAEGLDRLAPRSLPAQSPLSPRAILAQGVLWSRLSRGDADPLLVEELSVGLLVSALGSSHGGDGHSRYVRRAKEAICAAPERKWTLGELSDIVGISPYHLAHVFSREVGTSVYRYTVRQRLARALDAVLDSDLDLTSIALETGFASHSHFTARFRAFFGLTPDALRRSAGSGSAADLRKIVTAPLAAAA
jgi:AraC-like DNA-binding protein